MTGVCILSLALRMCAAIISIVQLLDSRSTNFRLLEQGGPVAGLSLLAMSLVVVVLPITLWVNASRIATRLQRSVTPMANVSVEGELLVKWGCVLLGLYILGSMLPTVLGRIALLTVHPLPEFLTWNIAWSAMREGATIILASLLLLRSGWIARRINRMQRGADAT